MVGSSKPRRVNNRGEERPTQMQRSARTRSAILAAAEGEFAAEGLAGARTNAIARAAGVNKAMLYYHFESKQSLYEAVVEEHFRSFNEQAIAVLVGAGAARDVLLRYLDLHLDFISSRRRYASLYQRMMMGDDGLLERIARKYFATRAAALDRLLARGERSGDFRKTDRTHTAISIAALIIFYFSNSRVVALLRPGADPYSAPNLRKRKEEVVRFIQHALFIEGKRR